MTEQVRNASIATSLLDGSVQNYRAHPPEQIKQLVKSLERFQQVRSIVVKKQSGCDRYTILAGHGLVEAARECYYPELRCDIVPDSWDELTCNAYLIADNQLSNAAVDDDEILCRLLQEQSDAGFDLASMGSDEETLRQMLESLGDAYVGESERDESEDELPEEVETRAKLGDIWQLGRHTVACMNSCDPETYTKLFEDARPAMVFSDPPYGINIVATNVSVGGGEAYDIPFGGVRKQTGTVGGSKPKWGKDARGDRNPSIIKARKYVPVVGDDSNATAVSSYHLCAEYFPEETLQIWWGANYYAHILPPSSCWIVWDKETNGNFADAELAWCSDDSAVRIFKHMWNGMLKDSEHGVKRVHPTQKPIALAEWCYEKYGKEHDIVYDPFLGSGMSLIAAQNTNRTVIGCELSPEYIDIIIARFEKLTGQTATLLQRTSEVSHA